MQSITIKNDHRHPNMNFMVMMILSDRVREEKERTTYPKLPSGHICPINLSPICSETTAVCVSIPTIDALTDAEQIGNVGTTALCHSWQQMRCTWLPEKCPLESIVVVVVVASRSLAESIMEIWKYHQFEERLRHLINMNFSNAISVNMHFKHMFYKDEGLISEKPTCI